MTCPHCTALADIAKQAEQRRDEAERRSAALAEALREIASDNPLAWRVDHVETAKRVLAAHDDASRAAPAPSYGCGRPGCPGHPTEQEQCPKIQIRDCIEWKPRGGEPSAGLGKSTQILSDADNRSRADGRKDEK